MRKFDKGSSRKPEVSSFYVLAGKIWKCNETVYSYNHAALAMYKGEVLEIW